MKHHTNYNIKEQHQDIHIINHYSYLEGTRRQS